MHGICMATKTISLELGAYEKLKTEKLNPRESFSSVVRRAEFPKTHFTCKDLLEFMKQRFLERSLLNEETLDRLEKAQENPHRSSSHWDEP